MTGSGATSFLWNELPGHGFGTAFPAGFGAPQALDQLATAASPLAGLPLDNYAEHTLAIVRRAKSIPAPGDGSHTPTSAPCGR